MDMWQVFDEEGQLLGFLDAGALDVDVRGHTGGAMLVALGRPDDLEESLEDMLDRMDDDDDDYGWGDEMRVFEEVAELLVIDVRFSDGDSTQRGRHLVLMEAPADLWQRPGFAQFFTFDVDDGDLEE